MCEWKSEGRAFFVLLGVAAGLAFGTGRLVDAAGPLSDWKDYPFPFWSLVWPDRPDGGLVSVPLWNPYLFGGYPHLADPQWGFFYPVWWLLVFLPLELVPRPFAFVHIFLALWGTYRYVRLDRAPLAATLAAILYGAGGVMIPHLYAGHPALVPPLALLPWGFLGARRIAGGAVRGGVVLLAAATALGLLAGHLPTVAFAGVAAWALAVASAPAGAHLRVAGFAALAGVLGLAVAGVTIVPAVMEILRSDPRGGLAGTDFATTFSWAPEYWASLWNPWAGADPIARSFPRGNLFEWAELTCFVGALPLLLAALALVRASGESEVRRGAIWLLLGIFLALGSYNPAYSVLLRIVPGLDQVRVPSRFLFFVAWGISLLSARGLEAVPERYGRRLPLLLLLLAAADLGRAAIPILSDAVPIPPVREIRIEDPHARVALGLFQMNIASPLRLRTPDGCGNFASRAYRLAAAEHGTSEPDYILIDRTRPEALRFYAVRYVRPFAETPPTGFSVHSDTRFWVFEDAVPRAHLPGADVSWIEDGSDRLAWDVSGPGGLLRVADPWHPDWVAWIDGRDAPVRIVDGTFRGVEVPPGRHRVEMRFLPWPLAAGAVLTLVAAAVFFRIAIPLLRRCVVLANG